MAMDIGELIFVQILQMSQYPGAPFTGNMFRDIILFLIVPTIFIIMVVYMMTIRIFPPDQKRLSVLLGVGAYMFILASGYYSAFALLAGPYFIFLIFILGLLYFFLHHFVPRRSAIGSEEVSHYSGNKIDIKMSEIDAEIEDAEKRLAIAQKAGSKEEAAFWAKKIDEFENIRKRLKKDYTNPKRYNL